MNVGVYNFTMDRHLAYTIRGIFMSQMRN